MASLVDILMQAFHDKTPATFNQRFFAPPPADYVDSSGVESLVQALQSKASQYGPKNLARSTMGLPGPTLASTWGQPDQVKPSAPQMAPNMMAYAPAAAPPASAPAMPGPPPTQGQAQSQPTSFRNRVGSFLDSPRGDALQAMFAGWAMGGTPGESLAMGGVNAMNAAKLSKKNKTLQMFLDKSNLDPALKGILADNPDLAKAFIAAQFKGGGDTTAEIKNWQFAQEHPDFAKMLGNQGGSFFGTPVPYMKPDGTVGYALTSRNGEVMDVPAPGGGQFLGPGGVAEAKAKGDARGTANFNLPSVERAIGTLQGNVNKLLTEPGLEAVTGLYGANTTNISQKSRRAQSYIDQVLGGTFLAAYNDLRGGGAITEAEGSKAVDAYNRLRATNMDTEDYRAALKDFNEALNSLLSVARQKAGVSTASPGASPDDPLGIR